MAKERAKRVGSMLPSGDLIEGGYVFYSTKYGPVAEYVVDESEGSDREGRGPWSVYRFSLDRHVPGDREFWNEDGRVEATSSVGISDEDFWRAMSSRSTLERAYAYEVLVGHYGPLDFDQYPITGLTHAELRRRYPKLVGKMY